MQMFHPGITLFRSALPKAGILLLLTTSSAQAYVDPGTGSMLLQMAAAAIAGGLFFLRDLRTRISAWFLGRRERGVGQPKADGEDR